MRSSGFFLREFFFCWCFIFSFFDNSGVRVSLLLLAAFLNECEKVESKSTLGWWFRQSCFDWEARAYVQDVQIMYLFSSPIIYYFKSNASFCCCLVFLPLFCRYIKQISLRRKSKSMLYGCMCSNGWSSKWGIEWPTGFWSEKEKKRDLLDSC